MLNKLFYYLRLYGPLRTFWYLLDQVRLLAKASFQNSHTPFGEDILIDNLLGKKKHGFYVDIGAYDPSRFSVTKRFYNKGWRGINIEPHPDSIKKFEKERPRDINLNIGITNKNGVLNFFKFENESLSTFSKKVANSRQKHGYKLVETIPIKVQPLAEILTKYKKNGDVDFLNIDSEGFEYKVLQGNDWSKFKPRVVCLEFTSLTLIDPNTKNPPRQVDSIANKFLSKIGYQMVATTDSNAIFYLENN